MTKKLLLTGCTVTHVGHKRAKWGIMMWNALRDEILPALGYEVDCRVVEPGEDLSGYDCAIVGVGPLLSLVTRVYKFGAVWTASQLPHIVIVDDWQAGVVKNSLSGPDNFWKSSHLEGHHLEAFEAGAKVSKEIEAVRSRWFFKGFGNLMMSYYDWGTMDHPLVGPDTFLGWDPSPWMPVFGRSDQEKTKRWVLAALHNYDEWLDELEPSWDVHRQYRPDFGGMKRGSGEAARWKTIPESEVVGSLYTNSWGVLSPAHPKHHDGYGWWRPRYNFAVQQCGSVLYAPEIPFDSFQVPLEQIELMEDDQLRELASVQRAQFGETTKAIQLAKVDDYLNSCWWR